MTLLILVTGGVISGLGKGVIAASIAHLMLHCGPTTIAKIDPYLNVGAGRLSPGEHGEVFVLADGAQTDLDFGTYERMNPGLQLDQRNAITQGHLLQDVLRHDSSGETQRFTDLHECLHARIHALARDREYLIIEVGGNVCDPEAREILRALGTTRQPRIHVHVTYVVQGMEGEWKTAPAQFAIAQSPIPPDIILLRSREPIEDPAVLAKVRRAFPSKVCALVPRLDDLYAMPAFLRETLVSGIACPQQPMWEMIGRTHHPDYLVSLWCSMLDGIALREEVSVRPDAEQTPLHVAVVGKYAGATDAYRSLRESVDHAMRALGRTYCWEVVDAETYDDAAIVRSDLVLVPGGFSSRGFEGKVRAVQLARTHGKPLLGICLGMQAMVVSELRAAGVDPAVADSAEMRGHADSAIEFVGLRTGVGVARLDACPRADGVFAEVYAGAGATLVERHRHSFGLVRDAFVELLETRGWEVLRRDRIVEWMACDSAIGVQYHPEFQSSRTAPHPVFLQWIQYCCCCT